MICSPCILDFDTNSRPVILHDDSGIISKCGFLFKSTSTTIFKEAWWTVVAFWTLWHKVGL